MLEYKCKGFLVLLMIINITFINCYFQISLFNQLNQKNKGKNLTISPLSIFQALSLVTNGANGETQNELLKLLDNKGMEEINEINIKIISKIKDMSSLEIANAIMTRVSPLPSFIKIAKEIYSSEIQSLKNVQQVNKWCDNKTHGKIQKIIDELSDNIFMIILNAVYFKGLWVNQFNKELTSKKIFYNYNSESDGKQIDTMKITKHFSYFQDSNLQAIKLPFRKDFMSALIILPNKNININEFINILNDDNEYFYSIIDNLKYSKVNLELPKFEITYKESLKEILKNMGVNLAFNIKADFSKIRNQNDLMIDEVIHKTYLKVNEEGTEAAAVTMIDMVKMAMVPQYEIIYNMIINRPFLFILRNEDLPKNYDILFISKIEELN
jgi:serpin B